MLAQYIRKPAHQRTGEGGHIHSQYLVGQRILQKQIRRYAQCVADVDQRIHCAVLRSAFDVTDVCGSYADFVGERVLR